MSSPTARLAVFYQVEFCFWKFRFQPRRHPKWKRHVTGRGEKNFSQNLLRIEAAFHNFFAEKFIASSNFVVRRLTVWLGSAAEVMCQFLCQFSLPRGAGAFLSEQKGAMRGLELARNCFVWRGVL